MSRPAPNPEEATTLLRCERLQVGYRGRALLPPIDLSIRRGTLLAVLGRNGSGKSTFFKTMLGFVPPVGGAIHRADVAPKLAYMAQAATLDPLVPVRGRDVAAWGGQHGWSFLRPARAKALRDVGQAGLVAAHADDLGGMFVRDLSEGQRARVMLGRMLAAQADVAFLDEPTAAMDAVAEQRTMALLREWTRERGLAVVIITHLLGLIRRYTDQVLYLDRDDGLAIVDTADNVFAHPAFRRQYGEID